MQSCFFGTRTEARNVMKHEHHQPEKHMQNMPTHFIDWKALKWSQLSFCQNLWLKISVTRFAELSQNNASSWTR